MAKTNADWRLQHRMPSPATLGVILLVACLTPSVPARAQVAAPSAVARAVIRTGFEPAFPEIQRIAESFVERAHVPGAAVGVIVDGVLVFETGIGVRDRATNAPATPASIFRIASMTKSFTAAAILKLRDEGRLSLDDPAERYVPELKALAYPTRDSPRITVRHLLSHSEGFPEDNPWGDRQLARTDAVMREWMQRGIPFSTPPGTAYEYSNYGFAILGQIVSRVSGQSYADYLRTNILMPLGMTSTYLDVSEVPNDRIAKGYRWIDGRPSTSLRASPSTVEGRWEDETPLAHGSFGAMGGLWTSTPDLGKWVAFLLDGFPARDDAESGAIRRASVREMQQVWRTTRATAMRSTIDGDLALTGGGYGYGLRIAQTCAFGHVVAHGGGLPGYGSQMQWLPEYGVGLIAMGNVTYTGWGGAFNEMWAALVKTGALKRRRPTPSPALLARQQDISSLIARWDDAVAEKMAADNFFLDEPAGTRRARLQQLSTSHGACRATGEIDAENALRGSWRMTCDRGHLDVAITLAPTAPPTVQFWSIRSVLPPSPQLTAAATTLAGLVSGWDETRVRAAVTDDVDVVRLRRQADLARVQYGACRVGEHLRGDGSSQATVRLTCDQGAVLSTLTIEPQSGRLTQASLVPVTDGACTAW